MHLSFTPTPLAAWLPYCCATVGVARDALPGTGSGPELFMPIGGSLSGLPRGDAPMGMYAAAGKRTTIVSVGLASDLPAATRSRFEYRGADNPRFAAMIEVRRHPEGMTAPGGVDVCDVPLAT